MYQVIAPPQKSNHRHRRLLRARSNRPNGSCTTNHRDEFAPPHCPPRARDPHRIGLGQSSEGGDVRYGSKADMCSAKRHVRFVPIADIPNS